VIFSPFAPVPAPSCSILFYSQLLQIPPLLACPAGLPTTLHSSDLDLSLGLPGVTVVTPTASPTSELSRPCHSVPCHCSTITVPLTSPHGHIPCRSPALWSRLSGHVRLSRPGGYVPKRNHIPQSRSLSHSHLYHTAVTHAHEALF
jgi:hypothetical protein